MKYVAKTFLGLEDVLCDELQTLGAQNIRKERRAVSFEGDLSLMYRTNIWLRTASRVLKTVCEVECTPNVGIDPAHASAELDGTFSLGCL